MRFPTARLSPSRLLPMAIALFLASCDGSPRRAESVPSTELLLSQALRTASVNDRVVFVKFRASWCEWCARLDAALHSFELGHLIEDSFVLVDITVQESDDKLALETPGGQAFMDSIGGAGAGLPFYVFLDTNGSKLADSNVLPNGANIGYPVTAPEIAAFGGLLEQTATRAMPDDLVLISDYLIAHAP